MRRPGSLWQQYLGKAVAEGLRGGGIWPLQPHPCELEPPWDEFDRRTVNLWDCIINKWEGPWEGSWLRKMFMTEEPLLPEGTPVVLPERSMDDAERLQPIVVEQFPDDESTIPKAEEFLRAIGQVTRPISFEILGFGRKPELDHDKAMLAMRAPKHERKQKWEEAITGWTDPFTVMQFLADRDDAPRIERLLQAYFPNSAVVRSHKPIGNGEINATGDISDCSALAATLAMHHFVCWPIRVFSRLDPDPLGVAITAMEDLDKNEWAVLQILFEPATAPWAETITEAVSNPYEGDDYLLADLQARLLREKFASPLFAASIRIASNRKDVFRQLEGWAEQFSAPPQGFFSNPTVWHDGVPEIERALLAWSIACRHTHRPGVLLNVQELASLIHLPGRGVQSERLRRVTTRTKAAAEVSASFGSILLGENTHRGNTRQARIPPEMRLRHCYLAGASGTGKSTLLLNMIVQDIESGQGVAVLDPHADLITAVLKRIPPHRVKDVILFDPTDEAYPFALNILEAKDESERERIVNETVMAMKRYFPSSWGPRLQQIFTFALYTVLDAIPGATLADVERLLTKPDFRRETVAKVRDQQFADFWNDQFVHFPKNAIDPVLNKLSVFLVNRTVRNIISQRHSAIDFDRLLNEGKILLASLPTGLLTEEISGMFGSFLVTKIINAAFRRSAIPEEQRRPFYLYLDEFQAFMNVSVGFDRILNESRKFRLLLAGLANQYVGQLTPEVRQAIAGNVNTMIVFRLGVDDAQMIARQLGGFTAEEILDLDTGHALVRAGKASSTFNLKTYPAPPPAEVDSTDTIRDRVRRTFARPRADIEAMLRGRADGLKKATPKPSKKPPPVDPNEDDLVQ